MRWVCCHTKLVTTILTVLVIGLILICIQWPMVLLKLMAAIVLVVFLAAFWTMIEALVEGVCDLWRERHW